MREDEQAAPLTRHTISMLSLRSPGQALRPVATEE